MEEGERHTHCDRGGANLLVRHSLQRVQECSVGGHSKEVGGA